MDIKKIVDHFLNQSGSVIDRGVNHPIDPRLDKKTQVLSLMEEYPFLKYDKGYSDFLLFFGGASFRAEDKFKGSEDDMWLVIHGVGDESIAPSMLVYPPSLENSIFVFAEGMYDDPEDESQEQKTILFGFDTENLMGVLRKDFSYTDNYEEIKWEPYCDSFEEWFQELAEKGRDIVLK